MRVIHLLKEKHKKLFSKQLFAAIFSVSLLVLFVGVTILYQVSYRVILTLNNQMRASTLEISTNNLDKNFSDIDKVIHTAFFQQNTVTNISKNLQLEPDAYSAVRHSLVTAAASNDNVSCLCFYDTQGTYIRTDYPRAIPFDDYASCAAYFSEMESYDWNNSKWYFCEKDPRNGEDAAFVNVREITPMAANTQKDIMLVAFLSEKRICQTYEFLGENTFIATQDGIIVSAVDKTRIGSSIDSKICEYIQSNKKESGLMEYSPTKHYYIAFLPTISSYLVVDTSSDVSNVMRVTITVTTILIIVAGLLCSAFWSKRISSRMTTPIIKLKATMEQVGKGDLSARSKIQRDDEIGYLSESFNRIMDTLVRHIEELKQQQMLTQELELQLLQMQINPHLLYNTLDSALYLLETDKTSTAVQILEKMSQYFKLSLKEGNKIVPLRDELQHIDTYLKLQNLCRMKNFQLRVDGEMELLNTRILHMLLQPIVENAVLHGFEGSFTDGTIEINLRRYKTGFDIVITDDGVGISDDELEALRSNIVSKNPPPSGYALWNVAQRIKLSYGHDSAVAIDSEFGEYTTVTIHISDFYSEEGEIDV